MRMKGRGNCSVPGEAAPGRTRVSSKTLKRRFSHFNDASPDCPLLQRGDDKKAGYLRLYIRGKIMFRRMLAVKMIPLICHRRGTLVAELPQWRMRDKNFDQEQLFLHCSYLSCVGTQAQALRFPRPSAAVYPHPDVKNQVHAFNCLKRTLEYQQVHFFLVVQYHA